MVIAPGGWESVFGGAQRVIAHPYPALPPPPLPPHAADADGAAAARKRKRASLRLAGISLTPGQGSAAPTPPTFGRGRTAPPLRADPRRGSAGSGWGAVVGGVWRWEAPAPPLLGTPAAAISSVWASPGILAAGRARARPAPHTATA
eukprot:gene15797-562_t